MPQNNKRRPARNNRLKRSRQGNRRKRFVGNKSRSLHPVSIYTERGDQTITFKTILPFQTFSQNAGASGIYTHGYSIIKPFEALSRSAYSPIAGAFELCKLKMVKTIISMPGATITTGGLTCAKMYRETRRTEPNPVYEGLIQERLVRRGKPSTRYTFTWHPIEPDDLNFYPFESALDNGRFGQINHASVSMPTPFATSFNPIIEYTFVIEFKYIERPVPPTISVSINPSDSGDSDESSEFELLCQQCSKLTIKNN